MNDSLFIPQFNYKLETIDELVNINMSPELISAGECLAYMHSNNLIHGDYISSNWIYRLNSGSIVVLDPGNADFPTHFDYEKISKDLSLPMLEYNGNNRDSFLSGYCFETLINTEIKYPYALSKILRTLKIDLVSLDYIYEFLSKKKTIESHLKALDNKIIIKDFKKPQKKITKETYLSIASDWICGLLIGCNIEKFEIEMAKINDGLNNSETHIFISNFNQQYYLALKDFQLKSSNSIQIGVYESINANTMILCNLCDSYKNSDIKIYLENILLTIHNLIDLLKHNEEFESTKLSLIQSYVLLSDSQQYDIKLDQLRCIRLLKIVNSTLDDWVLHKGDKQDYIKEHPIEKISVLNAICFYMFNSINRSVRIDENFTKWTQIFLLKRLFRKLISIYSTIDLYDELINVDNLSSKKALFIFINNLIRFEGTYRLFLSYKYFGMESSDYLVHVYAKLMPIFKDAKVILSEKNIDKKKFKTLIDSLNNILQR